VEFIFKNLIVWQKAMELARMVYVMTRSFPECERYALADQLRRAVVSIPSNIAEGGGRSGNRDYAHFLSIARGSLYEVMTQLELSRDFGYIDSLDQVVPVADEVSRMLTSMLKKYGVLEQKG